MDRLVIDHLDIEGMSEDKLREGDSGKVVELVKGRWVGPGYPPFIIAEIGINHQGSIEIAKRLIDSAVETGVDCVKFQKRTINKILTRKALDREYNNPNSFGATYGEHKEHLEFNVDQYRELKGYADAKGVTFSASGWDEESIDLLDEIGMPFFKIASADLTNFPLLEHTARKGKHMIISTGMNNFETVNSAVALILGINSNLVIMQCTSSYPTPIDEINLNVIKTYRAVFGRDAVIGYSGHENGIAVSLVASILGASVIERHFTLDRTMKGGDHSASLEPTGMKKLVRNIANCQRTLG